MLTNKQMWRKQRDMCPGVKIRRSLSEEAIISAFNGSSDSISDSEPRELSNRNSCSSLDSSGGECSPESSMCYSRTVEDLHLPSSTLKKIKKKLRFDNLVRVTLIPSITEYKDAGLHLFLWCSQNELQCYKDSAYEDIKEFMRESNCDDFTQAMKALFKVHSMIEPDVSAAHPTQPPHLASIAENELMEAESPPSI